jgi:hypothetical protein
MAEEQQDPAATPAAERYGMGRHATSSVGLANVGLTNIANVGRTNN